MWTNAQISLANSPAERMPNACMMAKFRPTVARFPLSKYLNAGGAGFPSSRPAGDQATDIAALLNRDLGDAWKWFPAHLQASCISHHENLGMRWNRAVSEHLDTTGPVGLRPKPSRCRRALHSRGPEDVLRPDPFSSQDDAFGIYLLHRRTAAHFHAQFSKFGGRGGRECLVE